jgi:hypothetical protein
LFVREKNTIISKLTIAQCEQDIVRLKNSRIQLGELNNALIGSRRNLKAVLHRIIGFSVVVQKSDQSPPKKGELIVSIKENNSLLVDGEYNENRFQKTIQNAQDIIAKLPKKDVETHSKDVPTEDVETYSTELIQLIISKCGITPAYSSRHLNTENENLKRFLKDALKQGKIISAAEMQREEESSLTELEKHLSDVEDNIKENEPILEYIVEIHEQLDQSSGVKSLLELQTLYKEKTGFSKEYFEEFLVELDEIIKVRFESFFSKENNELKSFHAKISRVLNSQDKRMLFPTLELKLIGLKFLSLSFQDFSSQSKTDTRINYLRDAIRNLQEVLSNTDSQEPERKEIITIINKIILNEITNRYLKEFDLLQLIQFSQDAIVPDYKDNTGQTLLHAAVAHSFTNCSNELIRLGFNLAEKNNEGFTPFFLAIKTKKTDFIDQMITHLKPAEKTSTLIIDNANRNIFDILLDSFNSQNHMQLFHIIEKLLEAKIAFPVQIASQTKNSGFFHKLVSSMTTKSGQLSGALDRSSPAYKIFKAFLSEMDTTDKQNILLLEYQGETVLNKLDLLVYEKILSEPAVKILLNLCIDDSKLNLSLLAATVKCRKELFFNYALEEKWINRVNQKNYLGTLLPTKETICGIAITHNKPKILQKLLALKTNVNQPFTFSVKQADTIKTITLPPLGAAIYLLNNTIIKLLIESQACSYRFFFNENQSILHLAINTKDLGILDSVLQNLPPKIKERAMIQRDASGFVPLHSAIKIFGANGLKPFSSYKNGFPENLINCTDEDGNNLLHSAILYHPDDFELTESICQQTAFHGYWSPNLQGETPLSLSKSNNTQKKFIEQRAVEFFLTKTLDVIQKATKERVKEEIIQETLNQLEKILQQRENSIRNKILSMQQPKFVKDTATEFGIRIAEKIIKTTSKLETEFSLQQFTTLELLVNQAFAEGVDSATKTANLLLEQSIGLLKEVPRIATSSLVFFQPNSEPKTEKQLLFLRAFKHAIWEYYCVYKALYENKVRPNPSMLEKIVDTASVAAPVLTASIQNIGILEGLAVTGGFAAGKILVHFQNEKRRWEAARFIEAFGENVSDSIQNEQRHIELDDYKLKKVAACLYARYKDQIEHCTILKNGARPIIGSCGIVELARVMVERIAKHITDGGSQSEASEKNILQKIADYILTVFDKPDEYVETRPYPLEVRCIYALYKEKAGETTMITTDNDEAWQAGGILVKTGLKLRSDPQVLFVRGTNPQKEPKASDHIQYGFCYIENTTEVEKRGFKKVKPEDNIQDRFAKPFMIETNASLATN